MGHTKVRCPQAALETAGSDADASAPTCYGATEDFGGTSAGYGGDDFGVAPAVGGGGDSWESAPVAASGW
jgi:hypothetical protein